MTSTPKPYLISRHEDSCAIKVRHVDGRVLKPTSCCHSCHEGAQALLLRQCIAH